MDISIWMLSYQADKSQVTQAKVLFHLESLAYPLCPLSNLRHLQPNRNIFRLERGVEGEGIVNTIGIR